MNCFMWDELSLLERKRFGSGKLRGVSQPRIQKGSLKKFSQSSVKQDFITSILSYCQHSKWSRKLKEMVIIDPGGYVRTFFQASSQDLSFFSKCKLKIRQCASQQETIFDLANSKFVPRDLSLPIDDVYTIGDIIELWKIIQSLKE